MEILYTDTRHKKILITSIAQMQTPQVLLLSKFLNLSHLHLKEVCLCIHACTVVSDQVGLWVLN